MEISGTTNLLYLTGEGRTEVFSGVYFNGVMYYDFTNVKFINNSGLADLVDLVKTWMEMGTDVRFIHVNRDIQYKFRETGLDQIINCE
ncbi:MAG: STAS domain-containing protein [Bacteroidota bacterium]|nr:STAS domain-containing protein [Bacteroidota bacterium]